MAEEKDYKYRFSKSLLGGFIECPRCFWFEMNKGIKKPKGISSSLPNGMDKIFKSFFDIYRKNQTLPVEIVDDFPKGTKLFSNMELLEKWRDWRGGLQYLSPKGVNIIGAFDDVVEIGDKVAPLDYKTRGYPLKKDGGIENSLKYYGLQLSTYSFLLEQAGYKITGKGYLVYYYPSQVFDEGYVKFETTVVEHEANPKYLFKVIKEAIASLELKTPPDSKEKCEYCAYREGL